MYQLPKLKCSEPFFSLGNSMLKSVAEYDITFHGVQGKQISFAFDFFSKFDKYMAS